MNSDNEKLKWKIHKYWQELYNPENMIKRDNKLPKVSKFRIFFKIKFRWLEYWWQNFKEYTRKCFKDAEIQSKK